MKKLIIFIIIMVIAVIGFLATMHICYSKENGVTVFPKESISFAYSIVNIDSMRTDARNDGLIVTMHNKPVIYILSRYKKHENDYYETNLQYNIANEIKHALEIYNKLALTYYMETEKYVNDFNMIGFTPPQSKYYTLFYNTTSKNIIELYVNVNIDDCGKDDTLQYTIDNEIVKNSGGYFSDNVKYGKWTSKSLNCKDFVMQLNSDKK